MAKIVLAPGSSRKPRLLYRPGGSPFTGPGQRQKSNGSYMPHMATEHATPVKVLKHGLDHSPNKGDSPIASSPCPQSGLHNVDVVDLTGDLEKLGGESFGKEGEEAGGCSDPASEKTLFDSQLGQQGGIKRQSDSDICKIPERRLAKRPAHVGSREPASLAKHSPTHSSAGYQASLGGAGLIGSPTGTEPAIQPLLDSNQRQHDCAKSPLNNGLKSWNGADENAEDYLQEANSVCSSGHPRETRNRALEDNARRAQAASVSVARTGIATLISSCTGPKSENRTIFGVDYCPPPGYEGHLDRDSDGLLKASASQISDLCSRLTAARAANSEIVYEQAMSNEGAVDMQLIKQNKVLTARIEALRSLQQKRTAYLAHAARQAELKQALMLHGSQGEHAACSALSTRYSASESELNRIKAEISSLSRVAEIDLQSICFGDKLQQSEYYHIEPGSFQRAVSEAVQCQDLGECLRTMNPARDDSVSAAMAVNQLSQEPDAKKLVCSDHAYQHNHPWSEDVLDVLQNRFHLSQFRQNQLEAINATLGGRDTFVRP